MGRHEPRARRAAAGLLLPLFLPLLAVAGALSFPAPAGAARAAAVLSLDVGVVVASNEGGTVDPALGGVRQKLKSMFNYTSYRLLGRQRKSLGIGETGEFALPDARVLRATPSSVSGGKVRIAIQILESGKNVLTTTLGFPRGGMVIVGGPTHKAGVLILLISAE